MDDQTRFWISQQIANNKGVSDLRPLFGGTNKISGLVPKIIIYDGEANFSLAIKDEFENENARPNYIPEINFKVKFTMTK